VKHKLTFTEVGVDSVRVYIESENGETAWFDIRALPPAGAMRQAILDATVQSFVADRALRRERALLKARVEELPGKLKHPTSPPPLAELIISCLAPENTAQAQLGDLQEMFENNVARLGEQQARRKYWMQVVSSLGPLLLQWFKRIGLITALVDYFRSMMGL